MLIEADIETVSIVGDSCLSEGSRIMEADPSKHNKRNPLGAYFPNELYLGCFPAIMKHLTFEEVWNRRVNIMARYQACHNENF